MKVNYDWKNFDRKYAKILQKMIEANEFAGVSLDASRGMLYAVTHGRSDKYKLPENTSVGLILMLIDDFALVYADLGETIDPTEV